jgi:hypothetical protein
MFCCVIILRSCAFAYHTKCMQVCTCVMLSYFIDLYEGMKERMEICVCIQVVQLRARITDRCIDSLNMSCLPTQDPMYKRSHLCMLDIIFSTWLESVHVHVHMHMSVSVYAMSQHLRNTTKLSAHTSRYALQAFVWKLRNWEGTHSGEELL